MLFQQSNLYGKHFDLRRKFANEAPRSLRSSAYAKWAPILGKTFCRRASPADSCRIEKYHRHQNWESQRAVFRSQRQQFRLFLLLDVNFPINRQVSILGWPVPPTSEIMVLTVVFRASAGCISCTFSTRMASVSTRSRRSSMERSQSLRIRPDSLRTISTRGSCYTHILFPFTRPRDMSTCHPSEI